MSYYTMPQVPFNDSVYKLINPFFTNISNNSTENKKVRINHSLYDFLAEIKCDIDSVQTEWDNIKKYTNQYEFIHTNVPGSKYSVSKLKPLSRSYYKMIEICKLLNIVDLEDKITSFHFAEGPGGFVEALCDLRKNKSDTYYAMTLQDKNDMCVPGWRKSKHFLEKHENVIIECGATEDGNLLRKENLIDCYKKYKNTCDIVTGDGGFDFSIDFNNQELISSNLIFSQIAYAVACQKKGGSFILKVFDTFTDISVDFIYLLSNIYECVFMVKPNTSRPANSEKYIVCKNFRVENVNEFVKIFMDILKRIELSPNIVINRLFKEDVNIPILCVTRLEEINAIYGQQQIESIMGTLSLIKKVKNNYSEKYRLDKLKAHNLAKCISWCQKYEIPHNKTFNTNNFMNPQ
jgi:23S rRNA U2552 (ribose-2'-O)-methylase RlmE/FtsJ